LTEPPLAILSIPDRFEIDSPIVARHVQERDVPIVAPAFRDPGIGGENGMPPFDEGELRLILRERMPEMRARGVLVPYVIEETADGSLLGSSSAAAAGASTQRSSRDSRTTEVSPRLAERST
jgi:hypothetical protein